MNVDQAHNELFDKFASILNSRACNALLNVIENSEYDAKVNGPLDVGWLITCGRKSIGRFAGCGPAVCLEIDRGLKSRGVWWDDKVKKIYR